MKNEYTLGAIILAVLGVGFAYLLTRPAPAVVTARQGEALPYKEIVAPAGFVNTNGEPIKIGDYIGQKVILLDVMTYSCINCQRTFPYVVSWYEKYKDQGFIAIGIHTPEFAFEKDIKNVEEAMKKFGITFPVVLDNDYGTWNAYGNQYWPRKYLIDIHGNIVYDHIGEGAYEETEQKIQELLKERAQVLGESVSNLGTLASDTVASTKPEAGSPETYFGSARNSLLANGTPGQSEQKTFTLPTNLEINKLYLAGTWQVNPESAGSIENAKVLYNYAAKDVYFVASSASGASAPVEVWQDGHLVSTERGSDVGESGVVLIKESRLYHLVHNPKADFHTLELHLQSPGTLLFTFTFG